ncbi:MAG: NAD-dependent epimerase/dehydratase family protein [Amnibacterium sp.]
MRPTALAPVAARYLFVSTANVYADEATPGQDEDAPLLAPLASDLMTTMEDYGPAKVACEGAVIAAFGPDRALIGRAGLLGGPGDRSGRSGYWPWRFAHPAGADGRVLVPEAAEQPISVLDARDLAAWLVTAAERGTAGVFDTVGTVGTLGAALEAARAAAGGAVVPVAASPAWLVERGVGEWMGPRSLPLWIADPAEWGMNARNAARARSAGLTTRPLAETFEDVLAWERSQPANPHGAGLTDREERDLLAALGSGEPGPADARR